MGIVICNCENIRLQWAGNNRNKTITRCMAGKNAVTMTHGRSYDYDYDGAGAICNTIVTLILCQLSALHCNTIANNRLTEIHLLCIDRHLYMAGSVATEAMPKVKKKICDRDGGLLRWRWSIYKDSSIQCRPVIIWRRYSKHRKMRSLGNAEILTMRIKWNRGEFAIITSLNLS